MAWSLPWTLPRQNESLENAARRIIKGEGLDDAGWLEQIGAFAEGRQHPSTSALSVAFVTTIAGPISNSGEAAHWVAVEQLPALAARQRAMVDAALTALRRRMDHAPVPFRLLPALFTLSELQRVYELLLGHELHKASFRRALHAAWLVEPTDEWRSEGRGRPARLFRFAPRKRRRHRRNVRFDLL